MGNKRKAASGGSSSSKSRRESSATTFSAPRNPHHTPGLSPLSAEVEDDGPWLATKSRAEARIEAYSGAAKEDGEQTGQHELFQTFDVSLYVAIGGNQRANDHILRQSLRLLLEWLPRGGRDYHARIILDASTDQQIWEHFSHICRWLAAPMKTTTRSNTSNEASNEETPSVHQSAVDSTLTQPQQRRKSFRKMLLKRDGYSCVVTRQMDWDHWAISRPDHVERAETEGAHIIPYAYASWHSDGVRTRRVTAWTLLYESFPELRHIIHASTINDPANGMTMRPDIHRAFGNFRIAFEATGGSNEYKIHTFRIDDYLKNNIPERITFQQASPDISLPHPELLRCHFAMANILFLSGMGELVENLMEDMDDVKQGEGCHQLQENGETDVSSFLSAGLWSYIEGQG